MNRTILAAVLLGAAATAALHAAPAMNDTTAIYGDMHPLHKPLHQISFDVTPNYVFPTRGFLQGEGQSKRPVHSNLAAHLKYGFRFAPDSYFGRLYPYATQGIGLAYNTFFHQAEVGSPLAVYVFQNSRICSLTPRLSLDYEWNFGVSFGWKEYDEESNPTNEIVGSDMNAYINLNLMLNWCFAPQWHLTAGVGLTHFSNGNTHYPNYGVNTTGARIGVVRTLGDESMYNHLPRPSFTPYVSYDLIVYGAAKKKGIYPDGSEWGKLVPGTFGVVGLNFNPMYNVSRHFRTGLSLDMQYDESANIAGHIVDPNVNKEDFKFYRPPFIEQIGVGISARAELVMPIFSINIGIGKNFICKGPDTNKFYQIIALKTHFTKRAFLHVGYQLYNFKDPNNLMLGIGYRFNGK